MENGKSNPIVIGVDITEEKVKEILDLPEEVVVTSALLRNKGLLKRFMRKYLYLFKVLAEGEKVMCVADLAIAYKMKTSGRGYWDCLPYGDVYPEILPIIYVAWAFGVIKMKPALCEMSAHPMDMTAKGVRAYARAARDAKRGRPANYPLGHLKTKGELNREWRRFMGRVTKRARREAAEEANKIFARKHGFYEF